MGKDKVYIILINYKNWVDTAECLESLLKLDYPNYQIIIVDNSEDEKEISYLIDFFKRNFSTWVEPTNPLRDKSIPPFEREIPFIYLRERSNGNFVFEEKNVENEKEAKVILIKAKENRGFAAGNNIAIKYAFSKNDFEYVWILNNDTVVDKQSLKNMVDYMKKNKDVGILGSKIVLYFQPDYLQLAGGGNFSKFLKRAKHFGREDPANTWEKEVELDHVIGASMFVRKEVLEKELMDEDFFMYVEETEWCTRVKKRGYKLIYFPKSVVFHKESVTIGKKNPAFFYYNTRNSLLFLKKHFKYSLIPATFYYLSRNFIFSLKHKNVKIFFYTLKGIKDFFLNKKGKLLDK